MVMTDDIILDGRESALTTSALFAAVHWTFEKPTARALLPADLESTIQPIYERLSDRWRRRMDESGVWKPRSRFWTRELIAERGQLTDGLRLSADETRAVVLALRACTVEFAASWWEMCTVTPGALDWYGLTHADAVALANRLERALE
jgi:hypothetical protein